MFLPHLPTVLLLVWIVLAMSVIAMWALRRFYARIPGLSPWLGAMALNTLAVGCSLAALLSVSAQAPLTVASHWLGVMALFCLLEGARRFRGNPERSLGVYLLLPAPVLAWLFWTFSASTLGLTLLHDLLAIALLLAVGHVMTRQPLRRQRWPLHGLCAALAWLLAIGLALRCVLMLQQFTLVPPSASQALPVMALLLTMIVHAGFTTCAVLLCGERARSEAALQAREDALTGLPNRRALEEALNRQIALAERGQSRFAVIAIDLERLRQINARLGRAAGNVLLQFTANRLRQCTREGDMHGRLEGEHFLVIAAGLSAPEAGHRALQRLQQAIEGDVVVAGEAHRLRVSTRLALWPEDRQEVKDLIRPAATRQQAQTCPGDTVVV